MKIKNGFILREVAGSFVVVAVGDAVKQFNGVINLNETGAFLWKNLQSGKDQTELVKALLAEYDVEESLAESDVEDFVSKLKKAGLVE